MKMTTVLFAVLAILGITAVAHADWASTIAADNPLHWYQFDETSGTTAVDSGSGGLNGTYTNGVVLGQSGLVGGAIGLDAVDDHVALGGTGLAGDWSAELIVMANGTGASQGFMGSSVAALKADQWNQTGNMGYTAFGVIDVTFANTSTPAELTHVVYVGTASGVDVYVDGVLADSATTAIDLPRDAIGVGRINTDSTVVDPLGGVIDEVVLYDRALGAGEIEGHFNAIPEPASLILLVTGALGLLLAIRRRGR